MSLQVKSADLSCTRRPGPDGRMPPALLSASTVPRLGRVALGDVRLSPHSQGHHRVPSGGWAWDIRRTVRRAR